MSKDTDQLLRDVLTANRAYVCRELEDLLLLYLEGAASEDEVPGVRQALELIRQYREGKH